MNVRMMLIAAGVLLSSASTAFAGGKSLVSPPAPRSLPMPQTLYCDITNIGTKPSSITIEALDMNGVVVNGPYATTVFPSTGDYMLATDPSAAYCRFTALSGSTKSLRAIALYDNGTAYNMVLTAE